MFRFSTFLTLLSASCYENSAPQTVGPMSCRHPKEKITFGRTVFAYVVVLGNQISTKILLLEPGIANLGLRNNLSESQVILQRLLTVK